MPGARAAATGEGLPPPSTLRHPGPRASDVRGFDGSRGLVCHTTFHSLLRSSSMPEPRRPPRRCLWTRLGAGTPRCLSALVVSRRRNATRRLPRLSGLTPFFTGFSAAWQPRRERRLPSALPQRAFGTDSSTPSPPVLLSCASFLLEPPASPKRTARGRRRRCHCCGQLPLLCRMDT